MAGQLISLHNVRDHKVGQSDFENYCVSLTVYRDSYDGSFIPSFIRDDRTGVQLRHSPLTTESTESTESAEC